MHAAIARDWFVQGLLSEIKPRDQGEALRVLDYAAQAESIEHGDLVAIARNLIASEGVAA